MKTNITHSKRRIESVSGILAKKRRKIKDHREIVDKLRNRKSEKKQKNNINKDTDDSEEIYDKETDSSSLMDIIKIQQNKIEQENQNSVSEDSAKFASALSEIISTINPSHKRDPILSCYKQDIAKKIANKSIENKARLLISKEKKEEKEKGRIKNIIPLDSEEAHKVLEYEKFLRKIAQKGVIKLFNAINTVQTKANKASKIMKKKGSTNASKREKEIAKMSKQDFLDLIKKPSKT
ncbi:hypothetical protein PORY_001167 [Pneumocystis oryctolagi]|uniref:Uncharacterized protein n=1 Tax=Pneumocystis oryctolagi TaxID=42067 RepID=A0ACB7CCW4_9ASCO|nr:hypothetical protein PORY_001167 [Pneumocystis oryctolagi]